MTTGERIRVSRDINVYNEQPFIFAAEVTYTVVTQKI